MMRGDRVKVESSGAVGLDAILQSGVHSTPDIDGLAARADREMAALVWNYYDDDLPAAPAPVHMGAGGHPKTAARVLMEHYRIDDEHSNAFTAWKRMGSPQQPRRAILQLEAGGRPATARLAAVAGGEDGKVEIRSAAPPRGLAGAPQLVNHVSYVRI